MGRVCSIEGCENPHRAKGFCEAHYERWRKYGASMDVALAQPSHRRSDEPAPRKATAIGYVSIKEIREWLAYSPDTGQLSWKVRRGPRRPGEVSASEAHKGYRTISLRGRSYFCHRVAWAHHYGAWPSGQIDHINQDTSDNRIANLREATQTQNQGNSKRRRDNTSGFKGVTFDKARGYFVAQIAHEGRRKRLVGFATAEEAARAYDSEAAILFGEFAALNFPVSLRAAGGRNG